MAIPVYCMPGMAASSRIFEHLEWPEGYQVHLLEWDEPRPKEGLLDYAARIAQQITAHILRWGTDARSGQTAAKLSVCRFNLLCRLPSGTPLMDAPL